jgi:protein O-GlcNAc transferase
VGTYWASIPGAVVCVPDDLARMTTYVLCEQGDWFEDELPFVRRFLQPGDRAVDVGANYGVYTLSMASCVGDGGAVWAFEPARRTATYLKASVKRNAFTQVKVLETALSDHEGEGHLALRVESELNALVAPGSELSTQKVPLRTLDACDAELELTDVAFLKLDAEGEEARILAGSAGFLTRESPLVLFEIKHGNATDLGLVGVLAGLGYASYRLVPGLGLLTPFDPAAPLDGYQLNLFACKADRAATLESRGLLARRTVEPKAVDPVLWRVHLAALPCGRGREWPESPEPSWDRYQEALAHAVRASVCSLPPGERLGHLERAESLLAGLSKTAPNVSRLATLARVSWALGRRMAAVELLSELLALERPELDEPFLPVCPRFDRVDPAGRIADAFRAAALEQRDRLSTFSSYFAGVATLPDLEALADLGFGGEANERRRLAIQGRRDGVKPSASWPESPAGLGT